MVEVRVTRQVGEVLADEGDRVATSRVDAQSAHLVDGVEEVRVSRQVAEVLAAEPGTASVTRVDAQSAHLIDGTQEVRVTRQVAEVLGSLALTVGVSRVDAQSAHLTDGTEEVRVTRQVAEVLAREGASSTVEPLPLADDAYIFLHNWATRAELSTSFLNDVSYSPDSGAESRRGLGIKPTRTLTLEWLLCDDDVDLERFEVTLRRMTEGRFQLSFYMDQQELDASYTAADDTILFDTTQGRWFIGQRIAIVQFDACRQVTSVTFHLVETGNDSGALLTAPLGVDVSAGSLVFPMGDFEAQLDVQTTFVTAKVTRFTLEASEAPGASQLPVRKSDTPDGFDTFDGAPIWSEQPDWNGEVVRGRRRHGSVATDGRAPFVDLQADRARVFHEYEITGERDSMWPQIEFFETRRGRLRSFWHVDQERTFTPAAIDPSGTFVSVSVLGDLADFDVEWDYVGIVMNDGTVYVRQVDNIQEILTVFRITMNTAVDTGLDVNDIARVARARRVRYERDELVESWEHTNYTQIDFSVIETLDEMDYES